MREHTFSKTDDDFWRYECDVCDDRFCTRGRARRHRRDTPPE